MNACGACRLGRAGRAGTWDTTQPTLSLAAFGRDPAQLRVAGGFGEAARSAGEAGQVAGAEELSINWTVLGKPSQGLGRRWGEVREFTSRTRGGSRLAPENLSRRVHLWTRLECGAN